jgi:hypothetical protein
MNQEQQPKKWKRGDIGPDGRVFWKYRRGRELWKSTEDYNKAHEAMLEMQRRYREQNREALAERKRRKSLSKSFSKYDGSSYDLWQKSLIQPEQTGVAIFSLTPDPGQTLAELIHELSGYPMEVCEQIANPPLLDHHEEPAEPAPELIEQPAPEFNPDLSPF